MLIRWTRLGQKFHVRHNLWEWIGFDFIEETVSNVDHKAADLHSQEKLSAEEKQKHLSKVSTSAKGPVKERLTDLIDADGNRNLSVAEIKGALEKFFSENPVVSKDLSTWGARHSEYEYQILEI